MYFLASASRITLPYEPGSARDFHPGMVTAPLSIRLMLWSGMIRSKLNSCLEPKPAHSGHAPKGLLNEKVLGSNSSTLMPQSGQAKFWLKDISYGTSILFTSLLPFLPVSFSLPSPASVPAGKLTTSHTVSPLPSLRLLSSESESLFSMPAFITSLSMTTDMLCLLFFSSFISSFRSYICPSTDTRT